MQPSDEIKSKLDIVELIREYVQLKQAGANWRACCPFHREKSPSFMVSAEKQIWHCFGCGKGGDVFSFIQEIEGLSFIEALRLLAPKAGVTLRAMDPKLASKRNRLLDIMDLSRRYYHKVLLESPAADSARQYLASRGLSADALEEWQIGYSPDSWDATFKLIRSKGFTENEIFLAGMIIKGQNRPGFYDRFRGRIMFPINDINGATVAFTARVSPEKEKTEKLGKYINSPQTQIYDKSKILFGLDKAKLAIKKADYAIIVEGQMDAITAHTRGFKNVIASSGTALTADQDIENKAPKDLKDQINLIKRYTNNIMLAFDMDNAGEMAANRGIQEAMGLKMNIKVIEIPQGKDPDECIRQDPGIFASAIKAAKPMMQYYFDKTLSGLDMGKVEDQRRAVAVLLPIIVKLGDRIEQDYWLKYLSEKIGREEYILREEVAKIIKKKPIQASNANKQLPPVSPQRTQSRSEKLSEHLLALIIKFPVLLEYSIKNIETKHIFGLQKQALYKNLIFYYNNVILNEDGDYEVNGFNYNDFRNWLLSQDSLYPENTGYFTQGGISNQSPDSDRLVLLSEKEFYDLDQPAAKAEMIKIIIALKKYYLADRKKELMHMIAEAEKNGDGRGAQELMEELKLLNDELAAFDR
ncbi:MAG: DNA primase [Candidatus Falkowbacteria bacterium]